MAEKVEAIDALRLENLALKRDAAERMLLEAAQALESHWKALAEKYGLAEGDDIVIATGEIRRKAEPVKLAEVG